MALPGRSSWVGLLSMRYRSEILRPHTEAGSSRSPGFTEKETRKGQKVEPFAWSHAVTGSAGTPHSGHRDATARLLSNTPIISFHPYNSLFGDLRLLARETEPQKDERNLPKLT